MATTFTPPATQPVTMPWWSWLVPVAALFASYLMLQENGWLLAANWETIHEFFHDGRHLLGVPCH